MMNHSWIHSLAASALLLWTGGLSAQTNLVDSSFNPGTGANDLVESLALQPDGKVLICGLFTQFNGLPRGYVARLNSDGSVDRNFVAEPNYWVRCLALQPDGKIIIGGFFKTVAGVPRNRIARLNSDGTLDRSFDPGTGCDGKVVPADDKEPFVFALAVQNDGKIVATGNFATYNSAASSGLVRVNADGTTDSSFHVGAGFDSWGRFLLLLPNDQILATGWLAKYNNQSFNRMVRLNSDGTADHSFNPYFGDETAIYGAALLPDGQIIAAGHSINGAGLFHQELARLNPDGTVDNTYNASANDKIETVLLQPDGKLVMGGYFATVNGVSRKNLARLNPDGSLDEGFRADTDNFVWTVRGQPDGKTLLCGAFYTVDGIPRRGVARILTAGGGLPVPRLASPRLEHGAFSVLVPTVAGREYALQYRSISSSRWTAEPDVPGDGTVRRLIDSTAYTSSNRIYRVIVR